MKERYAKLENCPACKSTGIWRYSRVSGPEFVTPDGFNAAYTSIYDQCAFCGLIFQNPMPDMSDFYSSGAYRASVQSSDEIDKNRAKEISGLITQFGLSPLSALDFGCGRGFLLDTLHDDFETAVMGVEPDPDYPKTTHHVYRSLDEVLNKFDLITVIHVLEHISDPLGLLKKLQEYLLPDGRILIQVPTFTPGGLSPMRLAHLTAFTIPSMNYLVGDSHMTMENVHLDANLTVLLKGVK